jgi:hypothetical protein
MLARSALWCFLLTATWSVAQMQVTLDHPVRRIEGVVQNEKGEPLPNIDVEVFGGRSLIGTAKSDSHGKFKTDSFEPGEYEVWFTYKPHPVFKDVIYKIRVNAKGSKEPIVITMPSL